MVLCLLLGLAGVAVAIKHDQKKKRARRNQNLNAADRTGALVGEVAYQNSDNNNMYSAPRNMEKEYQDYPTAMEEKQQLERDYAAVARNGDKKEAEVNVPPYYTQSVPGYHSTL